jgi:hypothetical protein
MQDNIGDFVHHPWNPRYFSPSDSVGQAPKKFFVIWSVCPGKDTGLDKDCFSAYNWDTLLNI